MSHILYMNYIMNKNNIGAENCANRAVNLMLLNMWSMKSIFNKSFDFEFNARFPNWPKIQNSRDFMNLCERDG